MTKGIILIVFGLVFVLFAWYPQIMGLVSPPPKGPPGANVQVSGGQFVITFTGDTSELTTVSIVQTVTPPGGGIADTQTYSNEFPYQQGLTLYADIYPGSNDLLINGWPTKKYPTHPGEDGRVLFEGGYLNGTPNQWEERLGVKPNSWSGPRNLGTKL